MLRAASQKGAVGASAGALAGILIGAIGAWDILGVGPEHAILASSLAGGALAYAGANVVMIAGDVVLLVTCALIAFTPIAASSSREWIRDDRPPAARLDAIVVLSSSVLSDSAIDAVAADRLLAGMELWRIRGAPRLVTTRAVARYSGRRVVSDADQARLLDLVGAQPSWTIIDGVASTRDEAVGAFRLLGRAQRIAVVTSPLHTRRACATFESVGFKVYCVAARERVRVTRDPHTPSDRLAAFRAYVYERAAMILYRRRGWA